MPRYYYMLYVEFSPVELLLGHCQNKVSAVSDDKREKIGGDASTITMANAVGSRWKGIRVADEVELWAIARAIPDNANSRAGLRSARFR